MGKTLKFGGQLLWNPPNQRPLALLGSGRSPFGCGHKLQKGTMQAPRGRSRKHPLADPPAGELNALFLRLEQRLDAITEAMVQHYRLEIPGYANLPREVLDNDFRPGSRRNLEIFFDAVRRGRGPLV